jgi:hypothetical protein
MQTMAKTLVVLPSQDDALAPPAGAGAFQKWLEGFAGFRAQIQRRTSGQNAFGWVQVSPRQGVEVHLPDAELRCLVQTMLMRLVDERTPCFFKKRSMQSSDILLRQSTTGKSRDAQHDPGS